MTKEVQEKCRDLLCNYQENLEDTESRNQLFTLILPTLLKWIAAWYGRRGMYKSKDEILSDSWDCFLYCINHYQDWNVPIPAHFTRYTNWFLIDKIAKSRKDDKYCVPIVDNYSSDYDEEWRDGKGEVTNSIISGNSILLEFRNVLVASKDKEELGMFDDALLNSTVNKKKYAISPQRYFATKLVYRRLIEFFLERV